MNSSRPAVRGAALRQAWDRISLYLPVMIMGGLALISYWVLRSTPAPQLPPTVRPLQHQPDYVMRGFSVQTFDAHGRLKNEVLGQTARHYPDTEVLEIDQAELRSLVDGQPQTRASASRLSVNADQTRYQLDGQVRIIRAAYPNTSGPASPTMTFAGESLLINTQDHTISSSRQVLITRGNDRISANQMHYSDTLRQANLQGHVRTILAARP